jgi:phosphatidylglycerophosphate synthase
MLKDLPTPAADSSEAPSTARSRHSMRHFTLVQSFAMFAATLVAWCLGDARVVAVAGAVFLVGLAWTYAGEHAPAGRFGVANVITAVRVALVVALCTSARVGPREALLVVTFVVLDALDGWAARRPPSTESEFGARFDMETDALFVLAFGVKLVEVGRVGAWMIVPGLLRYAYAAGIALAPRLGEAPRSRLARFIAGTMMTSFAISAWPIEPVFAPFAAVASVLVVFSFGRSLMQSLSLASGSA